MFRATHIGGPMDGPANDVHMAADAVPEAIFYAKCPVPTAPFPNGYMGVGYGEAMRPDVPWPGQVEYALDREASGLEPHEQYPKMETGVAVYRLVEEPS